MAKSAKRLPAGIAAVALLGVVHFGFERLGSDAATRVRCEIGEVMMKIEGGCHCGNIRYTAEIDPATVGICHCTDCQTLTGTAFRTVLLAPAATFRMQGRPKIYVKKGDSGNLRAQAFCGECGSPIYSAEPGDNPPAYNIRVGTVRQRAELVPKVQFWCRSSLPWLSSLPGERLEKQAGWTGK